jgi:protein-disulfide isomerase
MRPHAHFPDLPIEGAAGSPVRVVAYEDLACGDCAAWRRLAEGELIPEFGGRAAFVTRDFPLDKHLWAEMAAMASRHLAARDSAAALEFRRYCLERRADITLESFPDRLAEFAEAHGLDAESAVLSLESNGLRAAVRADKAEGEERGVARTPTVFIGETAFIETFAASEVRRAIAEAIAAAGA